VGGTQETGMKTNNASGDDRDTFIHFGGGISTAFATYIFSFTPFTFAGLLIPYQIDSTRIQSLHWRIIVRNVGF
jgi:hypothetical protein